jgi:hypothetical protein
MDGDDKPVREVVVMRLIREKINIPVPQIHAWGRSRDNPLELGPFVIMDFIHGEPLGKLWQQQETDALGVNRRVLWSDIPEKDLRTIYRQIAGFLLQLSTIHFSCMTSPALDENGTLQSLSPLSLKMQEIEAHGGVRVGGRREHYC